MNFDWLKRMMPRGLYGRAALILLLPMVTVILVVTVVFLQRHFEGVTRQMTDSMARELAFVSARIETAPDLVTAVARGQEVAAPLGLSLTLPTPADPPERRAWDDLSGYYLADELRKTVPNVRAIDLGDKRQVSVTLDGRWGPFRLDFDRRRVSASNPHQLLVLMIFTSLVMSGVASVFLRNQLRPIRRLARAAEEFGKGRVIPFRPQGAVEIRSAGAAFLDMRNRLERLNEQRTLMLSGISHDLRTPLTRMRLGLSMLSDDVPPDRQDIAALEGDVDEMAGLVDAFLAFTRDEVQQSPAEQADAMEFVRNIVADARRAGQPVELGAMTGQGTAMFRSGSLRRAIENLIGNAVRYGGRAVVDATLGPRSLRITVEDDGPGIPEDRREEAVRPFTRLDKSRNQDRGSGVGLGLSIAADVARAHGGQLRLTEGRQLKGLRAEIVIPR
ncbi:ATP-binding protein [Paracoccus pacificus]|uniref:histidine kinase n=1 Tax=Paracoccus pacificus TaxID=1463598 RepID=A0ABW4R5Y3_9RHOB